MLHLKDQESFGGICWKVEPCIAVNAFDQFAPEEHFHNAYAALLAEITMKCFFKWIAIVDMKTGGGSDLCISAQL